MEPGEKLKEKFEYSSCRELARELEVPEGEAESRRREKGFLRITDFSGKEEDLNSLKLDFELDEMKKRQLQGFIGEKVTAMMEKRVIDHLKDFLRDHWVLRSNTHLVRKGGSSRRYWMGGKPGRGEVELDGDLVKHFGAEDEGLRQEIQDKCVLAGQETFQKYQRVRNPWIDFNFHAIKLGDTEEKDFSVKNYSKSAIEGGSSLRVRLPVVEDFKVIALEVKSTKGEEEKLLSENQRKVKEVAENSPFIDFFTLKVDTEFSELDVPENFSAQIKRHT